MAFKNNKLTKMAPSSSYTIGIVSSIYVFFVPKDVITKNGTITHLFNDLQAYMIQ